VDVAGLVAPRVRHVPEFDDDSLGVECVEFARSLGLGLDPWQEDWVKAVNHRRRGGWASFENGLCTARQQGKNVCVEAVELFDVFERQVPLTIHSGHDWSITMESFNRVVAIIESNPDLERRVDKVLRSHAAEGFNLVGGGRMRFRTRSRGGGRGWSCSTITFDESNFLAEFGAQSLLPALRSQKDARVLYIGTALDALTQKDCLVWARLRERARQGEDQNLMWMEWSTTFFDAEGNELGPDRLTADQLDDQEHWLEATPAAPHRVSLEHLALERRSMSPRAFAIELLGVHDPPSLTGADALPIGLADWQSLAEPGSEILRGSPVCFAVDVGPDLRTSICVAGRRVDGRLHVELVDSRPGTKWVPARLAVLEAQHETHEVVMDAYGFARNLADEIEEAGVPLRRLETSDATAACATLISLIGEDQLRHLGDPDLLRALEGASTRSYGDAWLWARRTSSADVTALVAATNALHAAAASPEDVTINIW
jgi:hypothetical protein